MCPVSHLSDVAFADCIYIGNVKTDGNGVASVNISGKCLRPIYFILRNAKTKRLQTRASPSLALTPSLAEPSSSTPVLTISERAATPSPSRLVTPVPVLPAVSCKSSYLSMLPFKANVFAVVSPTKRIIRVCD